MRLPNGERAFVDLAKLTDYCLSPAHPIGKNKARVFQSALGITSKDSEILKLALLEAAASAEATWRGSDAFGDRYEIKFPMTTSNWHAIIRSGWIVRRGEDFPRLVTCHVD